MHGADSHIPLQRRLSQVQGEFKHREDTVTPPGPEHVDRHRTPSEIIFTNIRFPKDVIVFTLMVIHASFNFP